MQAAAVRDLPSLNALLTFLVDLFATYGKLSTLMGIVRVVAPCFDAQMSAGLIASARRLFLSLSDLLVPTEASWSCRVCTFLNKPDAATCAMCSSPSGARTQQK